MIFSKQILGSSISLPAHGRVGARATSFLAAHFAKQNTNSVGAKREGAAEGGCGGNSAAPERKIEASPAACSVRSRSQQKSFLFLLEEKIRRAQIRKSRENFFAGWRASASGGGAASIVGVGFPLKKSSREVYNYSTKTNFFGNDCSARACARAPQGKIRFCFRRKIPEFAPITI